MLYVIIFLIVIVFAIIILFSFPKFSPIPYFPSNPKDMDLIIEALDLKNNQTIVDLGAGDGIVIFNAAKLAYEKKLNTQFIAVDINPVLILIMHLRRLFHPNRKNIRIICTDMFKTDFNDLFVRTGHCPVPTTFYLYISPWLLDQALKVIKQCDGSKKIVSYFYAIKSLKEKSKLQGLHPVYLYDL
jgi:SAM-dependent methyltransferase